MAVLCCGVPKFKPHDAETKNVGVMDGSRKWRVQNALSSTTKGGKARQSWGHPGRVYTYSIANFRGLSDKTGNKAKQIMKQARAARLNAPNMRSRSHLLTAKRISSVHSNRVFSGMLGGRVHDHMRVITADAGTGFLSQ